MSNSQKSDKKYLCPSAFISDASLLLGIVNDNGEISYFGKPLNIPDSFRSSVQKGNSPEKRFRFSTECFSKNCVQWKNNKCSIGEKVKKESEIRHYKLGETGIPNCGIRSACRWYKQEGIKSCMSCKFIITNTLS